MKGFASRLSRVLMGAAPLGRSVCAVDVGCNIDIARLFIAATCEV